MNLDQRIGKRVSIGLNMSYTNIATTNQSSGQSNVIGEGTNSLVHNAYGFAPYVDASFEGGVNAVFSPSLVVVEVGFK